MQKTGSRFWIVCSVSWTLIEIIRCRRIQLLKRLKKCFANLAKTSLKGQVTDRYWQIHTALMVTTNIPVYYIGEDYCICRCLTCNWDLRAKNVNFDWSYEWHTSIVQSHWYTLKWVAGYDSTKMCLLTIALHQSFVCEELKCLTNDDKWADIQLII